jgi:hypothetical protein
LLPVRFSIRSPFILFSDWGILPSNMFSSNNSDSRTTQFPMVSGIWLDS